MYPKDDDLPPSLREPLGFIPIPGCSDRETCPSNNPCEDDEVSVHVELCDDCRLHEAHHEAARILVGDDAERAIEADLYRAMVQEVHRRFKREGGKPRRSRMKRLVVRLAELEVGTTRDTAPGGSGEPPPDEPTQ